MKSTLRLMFPLALFLTASLPACFPESSIEQQRDGSPDSYVPVEVSCNTTCYGGHSFSAIPVCTTPGRVSDATLNCPQIVTKCFCTKKPPAPAAGALKERPRR